MKLRRLRLDAFGALQGEYRFDPERVALLVDDNERGKSTLLAALAAALYGLDNDKRTHKTLTPLERWRPWRGGSYRLELELECGGRVLHVKRDFERNTVEVWDDRGQEVTSEFRSGKDQFPVGQALLGLDADEFARCAFIGYGDLSRVVSPDARERANGSLRARLESAADSKAGDTSATEAIGLIEGALRRYTCQELGSSLQVDTAIQRLENNRGTLEIDLRSLEHDLEGIQAPLEALSRLGEEEQAARDALAALDSSRDSALAADVRAKLEAHDRRRAAIQQLEAEAGGLRDVAGLPADLEARFADATGRYETAIHKVEGLDQRRAEEVGRERDGIRDEMAELAPYAAATVEDADRCVTLAAERRRDQEEGARFDAELATLRTSLTGRGHEPERLQWLTERFGTMEPERQAVLRRQSDLQLAYQTEVAGLERDRTQSTETLREIDGVRNRWRLPGWFLVALGLAAAVAGVAVMLLKGLPVLWTALLAAGAALLTGGLGLLGFGGRTRGRERAEALRRLTDAQRRLTTLKQTRAETEVSLQIMARKMGYRDQVDLLKEWNEYLRMMEDSGPAQRAQHQLAALEARGAATTAAATELLARFGGGEIDPASLEAAAARMRRAIALVQRARELESRGSRLEEDQRVAAAEVAGLRERMIKVLQLAGLTFDPVRPLAEQQAELHERLRGRVRHALIQDELLPRERAGMLEESAVAGLRAQLASIEASLGGAVAPGAPRSPLEIEGETRRLREAIDALQRRRQDLRVQVEEVWRRVQVEHPERLTQKERIEAALMRARRFKHAGELARETIRQVAAETHRRWADHLNHRVGELLAAFGTGIEQVRFGDDLDFSVRVGGGQQLARGKADLQLSSGARDQLYLAVRLAVSEFLSRGQAALPLLLDDVFVSSDDARTRAGLALLAGSFGRTHQVILLTCHRQSFEALAAQDPELFRERIQWIDGAKLARSNS